MKFAKVILYIMTAAMMIIGGCTSKNRAAWQDCRCGDGVGSVMLLSAQWLADNIGRDDVAVIDLRPQPQYNTSHIPGSLCISVESFRGNIGGSGSMLLPHCMLAAQYRLMGLNHADTIVFVYGDNPHDASLAAMSCERLGHKNYGILDGGYLKWKAEGMPTDNRQPQRQTSRYGLCRDYDEFTVDYQAVRGYIGGKTSVIIDVRPAEYYRGDKTDEARAGHIPGAVNRPYTEDIDKTAGYPAFKTLQQLQDAYSAIIPSKDTTVILHCRTGHQASQTFFILKHLLDYKDVLWYDAGWNQWAAIDELPVEK